MIPRLEEMMARNPNVDAKKAQQFIEAFKKVSQMEGSVSNRASYTVAHPFERTPKLPSPK